MLFTTDEHSHLLGFAPELDDFPGPTAAGSGQIKGGALRRSAVLARERAAAQEAGISTITASAGDFSDGVPRDGQRYHAHVAPRLRRRGARQPRLRHHPRRPRLRMSVARARAEVPPFVLTNLLFSAQSLADDVLEALYGQEESGRPIGPVSHRDKDGMRIGVVAVMGALAARDAGPFAAPVTFSSAAPADHEAALAAIIEAVKPVVVSLRADHGADVVIVLDHGGIRVPGSDIPGDDERLAAAVPGIDLLVSGHTHNDPGAPIYITDPDGRQVPVLQAAPFGQAVGRAALIVKSSERPEFDADHSGFIPVDDRIVATAVDFPAVQAEIDEVLAALEDDRDGQPCPSS